MLTLNVIGNERFDESTKKFVVESQFVLQLEHSLVSLSMWESKWEKAFLTKDAKTPDEISDYVRAMILTPNVTDEMLSQLTTEHTKQINEYIDAKMTATWFYEPPSRKTSSETVTSELIYYWMIALTIPFECQHWHLNRLLTLIRVCNVKNAPPKKMSRAEVAARNSALNAQRKAALGTTG